MTKKIRFSILSIVISILLFFSYLYMGNNNRVANAATNEQKEIITEKECEIAAQKWILQNYNDETKIKEIIPILGGEEIVSYCVSFIKDNNPNGYMVIDANKNAINYLLEFSLSGKSIYDTLSQKSGINRLTKNSEKVIYSLGGLDYSLQIEDNRFYTNNGEIITKNGIKEIGKKINNRKAQIKNNRSNKEKEEYYNGFFTDSTIPTTGNYVAKTITGADSFIPSIMSDLRAENGYSGNCAPTAATNLLSYYREQRGFDNFPANRKNIYNCIVITSKWDQYGTSGMTISEARDGIGRYIFLTNYHDGSLDLYNSNDFTDALMDLVNDYPVYTSIRGYKQTKNGWQEVGHAVVTVGYRIYGSLLPLSNAELYLRVYDGWSETNDKYIWYSSDYFTNTRAMTVRLIND